ncbi:MAG TPA: ABC transporter substrate-binding protein [Acidimicrobiia bacterium]|nr:ABC transporter substrate-binding protein [Acidimicrobiia bacterium]
MTTVLVVTIALAAGASLPAASAAPKAEALKATDVGVSPTTIRVAIVTDVDNPIVPGVLQGIVDGMQGWGRYANAKGGLAGRKVQVDFIDSHLNPNEARNAIIQACREDFALVGTGALLLTPGAIPDETGCADSTGAATGLPDIGALDTAIAEACSPVSFPFAPNAVDCSTATAHPQTFRGNQGDAKYLLKRFKDLHGAYSIAVDSPSVKVTSNVLTHVYQTAGIKSDHDWQVTGSAPQTTYTPIIQAMKADKSNYALSLQAVNGVVQERQEAVLQGLSDPNIVWECTLACYYAKVFTDAGQAVDGEYMSLGFLPFDEGKANPTVKNFVKYVGKSKLSGFASWGFTAGLEFQQAVQEVVSKNGNNGLTRANLLTALKNMTKFNAGGMIGTTNVAQKIPTSCFMVEQWKGGKFSRVYPKKPGTFDCKPSNSITFQADYLTS